MRVASGPDPAVELPAALIELLKQATEMVALTGAGVSAESGVPTFRDAQSGLWSRYRAEDLATPEAFRRDPALVWNWYAWRRSLVQTVKPNPTHLALAALEQRIPGFQLLTQNVDALHRRAGSSRLLELHGDLFLTLCSAEKTPVETWLDHGDAPPRCPRCEAPLRPGVVWFGETLPEPILSSAFDLSAGCQVFLSIGTSSLVQPAAGLPLRALESGATVVEINTEPTPLSGIADFVLNGPAGEIVPALLESAWSTG
jgi:NAD-dependent deacetylase